MGNVDLTQEGTNATVRLSRGKVNALNETILEEIRKGFETLAEDDAVLDGQRKRLLAQGTYGLAVGLDAHIVAAVRLVLAVQIDARVEAHDLEDAVFVDVQSGSDLAQLRSPAELVHELVRFDLDIRVDLLDPARLPQQQRVA